MNTTIKNIRIGIVENLASARESYVNYLKGVKGLEAVFQASNGKEAIEKTIRYNPDVVLMEIKMPRMRGDTALERIRKQHPQTKIIVFTLDGSKETIARLVFK